jgi:hypothetical protein
MKGARHAWLHRISSELDSPDHCLRSTTSPSDLSCHKRFFASAAPLLSCACHCCRHVHSLLLLFFLICWSCVRLGFIAPQVPPQPSLLRYCHARPRCPPCGSDPSRHASPPSAHARTARVLGPHRVSLTPPVLGSHAATSVRFCSCAATPRVSLQRHLLALVPQLWHRPCCAHSLRSRSPSPL